VIDAKSTTEAKPAMPFYASKLTNVLSGGLPSWHGARSGVHGPLLSARSRELTTAGRKQARSGAEPGREGRASTSAASSALCLATTSTFSASESFCSRFCRSSLATWW